MTTRFLLPLLLVALAGCSSSDSSAEAAAGAGGDGGAGGAAGGSGASAGAGGSSAGTSSQGGAAGGAGAAGAGASSGASGAAGGTGGTGGSTAGAGGSPVVCAPGQQLECACPGSAVKGAQKCLADGSGFADCEGCPGGTGGAAGASGGAGAGGSAGQGGAGAAGQSGAAGAAGAPCVLVQPPAKWCGQCKDTCGNTIKCPNDPSFCDEKEACESEGGGVGYCKPKCVRAEKGDAQCAKNAPNQPYGYDCFTDGTELGCEPPGLSSTYCCSFPTY